VLAPSTIRSRIRRETYEPKVMMVEFKCPGRHIQLLVLFQLSLFSSCSPLIQERIVEGASTTAALTPSVRVLGSIIWLA